MLVPRDFVSTLESQNARLKAENEELQARLAASSSATGQNNPPSEAAATSGHGDLITSSLQNIVSEPSQLPQFMGVSSGITLLKHVMSAVRIERVPTIVTSRETVSTTSTHGNPVSHVARVKSPLPPRHAADHLVGVYFQYRTPHLPIVDAVKVKQALDVTYATQTNVLSDRETSLQVFIAHMVFAIALCSVGHPSGGRAPQSEECFHSALERLDSVFVHAKSQLDSLMAILLVAQYIAVCPSKGSLWLLTGTAIRLAVDLGLHWESDTDSHHVDPIVLDERRRLWHSTYSLDRMLCITLGRPFGIMDGTNVQLLSSERSPPDSFEHHSGQAHNHLIRLAQLESEVKHVLYSNFRTRSLAYPKPDYLRWLPDIEGRLQTWYNSIPDVRRSHPSSIFASQAYWDAIYHNALLLLYRPNPVIPQPDCRALCVCYEAGCKLIDCIKILHRERNIDIMWKWVYHIFMAGTTVLYTIWHPDGYVRKTTTTSACISAIQSCASTLSALSERWAGAIGCRDAFEALSSATVDWLITANQEDMERSRSHFEQHLSDLQQQLPPPVYNEATTDLLAMLSLDTARFGDWLNEAAQWSEDIQYVDFDDMAWLE